MGPTPWLLLGLAFAAQAADDRRPHMCVASWHGPTLTCDLRTEVEVRATGKTLAAAQKAAEARLRLHLVSAASAAIEEAEGTAASVYASRLKTCGKDLDAARLSCMPQPHLQAETRCWAELPRDACWDATIEAFDGQGWRAAEEARLETCRVVDTALLDEGVSAAERLRCKARCLTEVQVRCPGR
ncbi:MAG: hypothetical protein H6742_02630 [Alphaproteobacteria bacterium]|nr:hypothetical protein [Alphaproteobacteria bacterium]